MTRELRVKGNALGVFFAVVYVLCVAWDAIFAAWAMRSVWASLFPGWSRPRPGDFFLGLAAAYVWGWVGVLIFVPIWRLAGSAPAASEAQTVALRRRGEAYAR